MSNRLLQNYLDLSLSSKKSLTKQEIFKENENKAEKILKCQSAYNNSKFEINRIPSEKKKVKYSVSTVATQADMNLNSLVAERVDYMYRNQEFSDVESQILGIEVHDFCNDQNNVSFSDFLNNKSVLDSEKACTLINEYAAFKNSIRLTSKQELTAANSIFDLYQIDCQSLSTSYESTLKCNSKSITDMHNKLVLKFTQSITDEHLKLDNDVRKFSTSNQTTSASSIVPLDFQDASFNDNENNIQVYILN
jgi:hypothetical protein